MTEIRIGIVGGGYMGKRHAAAFSAVRTVFETALHPRLVAVAASSVDSAARYAQAYGFDRIARDWQEITTADDIDAVIIASPQDTHEAVALSAFAHGKHVLCEKPLSVSVESSQRMIEAWRASGRVGMVGFNYIRTPVTQAALDMVAAGRLGQITSYRGEHCEDFLHDPDAPANWRCFGDENGAMGDLAPHILQNAMAFMGPIDRISATCEPVHFTRQGVAVENDDQAAITCRFASGALGQIWVSRVATGQKMGLRYEITGTMGSLRFDQEDQNALWFYDAGLPAAEAGFRKILGGPAHPDYWAFCDGPAHGTGYGDQIVAQAKAFLGAIETGNPVWPNFADGLAVDQAVHAALASSRQGSAWVNL